MSMQTISGSSFSLMPLHESAYQLEIDFINSNGVAISKKIFPFAQQHLQESGEILDVYSQNGISSKPIFSSRDVKDLKKAVEKLKQTTPSGPLVLVLDIKDQNNGYLNVGEITKCEQSVCEFFQKGTISAPPLSKHAKKIKELFWKPQPLDFVICEGSLKATLLTQFSDTEAGYFLSKQGAVNFCQCAEFFMNGAKFGQESLGITSVSFIQSVSNATIFPHAISTVWYPEPYKDIYSPNGAFANTLKPIFSIQGEFDSKSKITSMSLEQKV